MIRYKRSTWFGISYLLQVRGSLLPRCLPWCVISGAIAVLLASGTLDTLFSSGWDPTTFFTHPYSMQLFGLVFGYLAISRTNICCMLPARPSFLYPLPTAPW